MKNFNQVESSRGNNLLHLAVKSNNDNLVKMLIKKGVDPNQKNKEGKNPAEIAKSKPMEQQILEAQKKFVPV